jgi:hypothetical protein
LEKCSPKIQDISVMKILPKVNNRPMGENSPNLVTLFSITAFLQMYVGQGCQMVCLQTKNPNLGKFWRALD